MIHILSESQSILNQYISEIRDAAIQKDSMRFRNNLERIGEIFAYEISKEMEYQPREVVTGAVPAILPQLPKDQPANRLTLARWIVSPENPLTSRVVDGSTASR